MKLAALAFAAAVVLLSQYLADLRLISPIFFPSPSRAIDVLVYRVADGSIWQPFTAASLRMVVGSMWHRLPA